MPVSPGPSASSRYWGVPPYRKFLKISVQAVSPALPCVRRMLLPCASQSRNRRSGMSDQLTPEVHIASFIVHFHPAEAGTVIRALESMEGIEPLAAESEAPGKQVVIC